MGIYMRRLGGGDAVNDRSAGVIMEVFPAPLKGPRTRPQTAKETAMAKNSPFPLSYYGSSPALARAFAACERGAADV